MPIEIKILIIVISVIIGIFLIFVLPMLLVTFPIAKKLYKKDWIRSEEGTLFPRGCSAPEIDYHLDMFNQGMKWREDNISFMKEVQITSLGDKLFGEYFDFGFDRAIILLPGRAETCWYACYYGEPFKKAGYNLLCIDPRAHGLSEGKVITMGKLEGEDAINWAKFLHDEHHIKHVCLYGLCGGGTAACIALANENCPSYIDLFINDGMPYSFVRVFKLRTKHQGHMTFPVTQEFMYLVKKHSHINPYSLAPYKLIRKIKVPTLFMGGTLDFSAPPSDLKKLYDNSASNDKQIHVFDNCRHSHLRYDSKEEYDNLVISFLKNHNNS